MTFILLRILVIAGAIALAATPARAASFDCVRATQPIERAICADAQTSSLDERMAAAYRRAMATPWAAMVRAGQRQWLRETRAPAANDPARLREAYRARVAALEASAALAGDPGHAGLTAVQIRTACVALPPDPDAPPGASCQVRESGPIGTLDGSRLVQALYAYPDPAHPDSNMQSAVAATVFAAGPDGRHRLIFADRRGPVACAAPRLIAGASATLLHLRCSHYGTGNFNAESIYAWRDGGWHERDIESWTRELLRRLPDGLGAWKGIFPDYVGMTARTPLWQGSDGNCCPTGGRAEITLAWQGERVVLRDLRIVRGRAAAEQ